jgi:hypothetical protein
MRYHFGTLTFAAITAAFIYWLRSSMGWFGLLVVWPAMVLVGFYVATWATWQRKRG